MDNLISFRTNKEIDLLSLKVYFNPIQTGSGDPNSNNIRTINGHTNVTAFFSDIDTSNPIQYPISWQSEYGVIYGGYIDLITGELVETWATQTFNGTIVSTVTTINDFTRFWTRQGNNQINRDINKNNTVMCDTASVTTILAEINNPTKPLLYVTTYPVSYCIGLPTNLIGSTVDSIKAYLTENPITIAFERETPIIHQLTPQQIKTFIGRNNLWSDADGVEPIFNIKSSVLEQRRRDLFFKDYIDNVEWVDYSYISSSGKYIINEPTSTAHYTQNAILLKAGLYKLVGFSYQEDVGEANKTNFRIHAYNVSDVWQRQITYQLIDWMSPVNMSFNLTEDTYVRMSIARKFSGHLIRVK